MELHGQEEESKGKRDADVQFLSADRPSSDSLEALQRDETDHLSAPSDPRNASALIWTWKAETKEKERQAEIKKIRRVVGLRGLVGISVAGVMALTWSQNLAIVVASVATTITLITFVSPLVAHVYLEKFFTGLGIILGTTLSKVVLTFLYFGFFVPMGLLRIGNRRVIQLTLDPRRTTYWEEREASVDPESYKNQF